jgi:biofilm PGA synthesis N-glycosyltransferase PgaC
MDLTWTIYGSGKQVRFIPDALCYPIEPYNLDLASKQLRRWSHGFVQNVRLHRRSVLELGYLRSMVAVAFWDAVFASLAYVVLLPALAIAIHPAILLAYLVDLPVVAVPVLIQASRRREVRRALMSLPSFFVLRVVNGVFMLSAMWRELVMRRPLVVWEKGH